MSYDYLIFKMEPPPQDISELDRDTLRCIGTSEQILSTISALHPEMKWEEYIITDVWGKMDMGHREGKKAFYGQILNEELRLEINFDKDSICVDNLSCVDWIGVRTSFHRDTSAEVKAITRALDAMCLDLQTQEIWYGGLEEFASAR